jgi:hypothetical protein
VRDDDHRDHVLSAGHFIVTGPDTEPLKFKSRREAKTGAGRDIPARR